MRLRRNSTNVQDYDKQGQVLINNSVERGYPVNIVVEAFRRGRSLERKTLLDKKKAHTIQDRIPFALEFTPRASSVKNILRNWFLVKHIPGCELLPQIGFKKREFFKFL